VLGGQVRCARGADCLKADELNGVPVGGFIHPLEPWDLDHSDDRRHWMGPAHRACNRSAGARKRNAKTRRSRAW
jgi:hypothetical protein